MNNTMFIVVYIVFFIGLIYFMSIRPSRNEKKKRDEMMSTLAIGDYICTNSGMYGQVIDLTSDLIIVEFGSNKNCRIPMLRSSIQSIEKTDSLLSAASENKDTEA